VQVAKSLFGHTYEIQAHLVKDERKLVWVRHQMDRLKLGRELEYLPWGSKKFRLPESSLQTSVSSLNS
jgi:hypothetical protein